MKKLRQKKPTHSRSTNHIHRASKRSNSSVASRHLHDFVTHNTGILDGRQNRVSKACERCRMRKTKCDGESPCKRCKDYGVICRAGPRKKVEYKQLVGGYAEVLENTQLKLIATVRKLYSMVCSGQAWELGDPGLNDYGFPIVHNIVEKFGCIRPDGDIDLPVHSVFPGDEASMAELAIELEDQQSADSVRVSREVIDTVNGRNERAYSTDGDHLDQELDRLRLAFGYNNYTNSATLSLQSYAGGHGSELESQSTGFDQVGMFTSASSLPLPNFVTAEDWTHSETSPEKRDVAMQLPQHANAFQNFDFLSQGPGLMMDDDFGSWRTAPLELTSQYKNGLGLCYDCLIYRN